MFFTDFIAICFQNMPPKGPFTPLLTVTGIISICLHVVISVPPQPEPARLLSEEFISYINSIHTTWKVSVQPSCFRNEEFCLLSCNINYINSIHTTWKVNVQPRYFGNEEFGLLACNTMWSVESHLTFRRNMSPQSSGSKNELQHQFDFQQPTQHYAPEDRTHNNYNENLESYKMS
jgi:hypothetical protein